MEFDIELVDTSKSQIHHNLCLTPNKNSDLYDKLKNIENNSDLNNEMRIKRIIDFKYCTCFQKNYNKIYGNVLHLYFIIVFEILFYFNYIVDIEKQEIQTVLNSFSDDIKYYYADYINNIEPSQEIITACKKLDDSYINKNNSQLKENSYYVIWTLSIIVVLFTFGHIFLVYKINKLLLTIGEAILFITFISIFEYLFFSQIVIKYNIITSEQASCDLYNDLYN